jgi:PAS domain S-box-containing protein
MTSSNPYMQDETALLQDLMQLRSYAVLQLNAEGLVLGCNAGVEAVCGYRVDELRGLNYACLFSEPDLERGADRQALAQALTQTFEQVGLAMVRKDGERFRASLMLERVHDGAAPRVMAVVRDITGFFHTQKRVREAREVSLGAQRLDAMGKLTLDLSHDFNNLLSVIGNSLEMLAARRTSDESARRILDIAQRAVERGTQLTRQMLAFGRGTTLVPQVSDVGELMQGSMELYQSVCGDSIDLRIHVEQGLPPVLVDVGQLEAALLNLLSNSRDAMHGVGRVMLEVGVETLSLHGAEAAEFVRVSVGDSGPGIQPEIQHSVFEPFFTTKDVEEGSGLGLSQVQGFAAQSGGVAAIGTSAMGGAAVSMYFPALASHAAGVL